jgi:hypothetical protein
LQIIVCVETIKHLAGNFKTNLSKHDSTSLKKLKNKQSRVNVITGDL